MTKITVGPPPGARTAAPLTTLLIAAALTCYDLIPGFPNNAVGNAQGRIRNALLNMILDPY